MASPRARPDSRQRAGRYVKQMAGYRAFIPEPLPPNPPLRMDGELQLQLSLADRTLGRLDGSVQTLDALTNVFEPSRDPRSFTCSKRGSRARLRMPRPISVICSLRMRRTGPDVSIVHCKTTKCNACHHQQIT